MSLILLNLESKQQIKLSAQNPLVIGRKNIVGCLDKRVSRNHGKVTCTDDGKVLLEALHCNPCFFIRRGVPPVLQLNKNEQETLNEGDYLGLLPNAFWFIITSNKENKSDIRSTDQETGENIKTNISDENKSVTNSEADNTVTVTTEDCNKDCTTSDAEIKSGGLSNGLGNAELEKTRHLPLWMYKIDDPVEAETSQNKRSASSTREIGKKQKLSGDTSTNIKVEVDTTPKDLDVPSTSKFEIADELPNTAVDSERTEQVQGEPSKESSKKEGYENSVNSESGNARRPICQYEAKCYRENSQHKSEYCHPGDLDYIPYEERPLCQYGARCYRKNEKHRVEFRHPVRGSDSRNHSSSCNLIASSPLPPKRSRKNVQVQNYEDDEEEDDLEEPFVNDASSDEYVPRDSEEEEEDLNSTRDYD